MAENNQAGTPAAPKEEPGFIHRDQESDSSIGSGTSDQGIEPGMESQEDEFRHENYSLANDPSMFNIPREGEEEAAKKSSDADEIVPKDFPEEEGQGALDKGYGFINQRPAHGLVEEGPGPDA
jgi:hypothetical protein